MKKTLILIPFLTLALIARAQDFQTEIALVEALDFNGATLAKAPAGKSATLQLARTKFSAPLDDYTSLALPTLKLGNIIGHPTLGWDDTDFRIPEGVPAVYEDKWALNDVFTDGDFPVAIYGRIPSEKPFPWGKSEKDLSCRGRDPHLIMLLDPMREVKRVYNVRNLSITPKDSLFEDIQWAVVKDGVLYFSLSTVTAPDKDAQGNYLVAVDINTDKTLWMSKPRMINSSNFLIVGNSIICGLGGSGIPDYIYVLNRYTGVKTREYWIPTAATWFALGEDNTLYATLYDKHVAFKITK
ncbi:MAG: hypothetical protein IKD75_14700 [Prevotella sp.]|nr:hypothetical protein [Prevotella sp.]